LEYLFWRREVIKGVGYGIRLNHYSKSYRGGDKLQAIEEELVQSYFK
jgi:hypothetical protein